MAKEYVPIFPEWLEDTAKLTAQQKGYVIDTIVMQCLADVPDAERLLANDEQKNAFHKTLCRVNRYFASRYNGRSGEFHWHWQGGKTPQNQRERSSGRYAAWRTAVFKRDGFKCQVCGRVGGTLNAHHIKPWADNPALRFDVKNGVTLCKDCHNRVHRKKVAR